MRVQTPTRARVLAFYLPQFHPTPENDDWWGPGFTEWTNVAGARRRYPGHYQPHIPGELGFYDLRVPESRNQQAELARSHGIAGFAYWHYWFGEGRRMLERPLEAVVRAAEPDFPFCLAWANQTWSGVWHGAPNRVLMEQRYPGPADHRAHFDAVLPVLSDPRYFRVDGRPLFYILAPAALPDLDRFIELWQRLASDAGLPNLYFVAASGDVACPRSPLIDAYVAHHGPTIHIPRHDIVRRALRKVGIPPIYSFRRFSDQLPTAVDDVDRSLPCLLSGWDNTPRSGRRGVVLHGLEPERFRGQARRAISVVSKYPQEERIVFVKSWNEWAEGNHLEPDRRYGRLLLEALRDEVLGSG